MSLPAASLSPPASPFDAMAAGYDDSFTHSRIGTLMRQAVWRRLEARFQPGDRLLELNCGTGEDAVHLARRGIYVLATDISPAMVQITREKAERAGLSDRIEARVMRIEEVGPPPLWRAFDGVLSNFGGLNCVEDMGQVAEGLAACLQPGGIAMLCIMGPLCPWEWGWYLAKRQPGKALRRLKPGGAAWRGLTIRYPSIRAMRRAFAPSFRLLRANAVGAFVPPSYAETWAARHERLLARLNAWERRMETLPPLPWLADHCLLEFARR
ncbi:MAG TPA: methyltransferase domain-containing protein [Chthonomonadaceae bacterium]|nr:methyltransferase domain-containing protein [Chthonomonadaceae bacterium]